ncbi:MAG: glycosyltransferase family 4 protein [Bacteroidetes bacterium]|nr:glycosyltransferase family 4 protein [Bacteroidota bacterium]
MENTRSNYPTILFLHNKYLKTGGEDSVVVNEINLLKAKGYTVYYKEFNNANFQSRNPLKKIIAGSNFFFNLSVFIETYLFIKKHQIHVLHVHNFFYTASPSVFWAGRLAGTKNIMTMHNYRLFCLNAIFHRAGSTCTECIQNRNFKSGIKYGCFKSSTYFSTILSWSTLLHRSLGTWTNQVDHFLVLNPYMKELLQGIGVAENNIVIKPNFVRDTPYKISTHKNDTYLYAGRIEEEKGIRHVVEAFKLSGKQLVIAGDGSLTGYVQTNISNNIQYIGLQTEQEMIALYHTCKAFIFSSLLTEGMPMTLIEAFAAGTICIVATSPNTARMIADGADGILYDTGDPISLNQAIAKLEQMHPADLLRMSENARKKYETHYHQDAHFATIHQIYTSSN